jgi:hypothetical protein
MTVEKKDWGYFAKVKIFFIPLISIAMYKNFVKGFIPSRLICSIEYFASS